MPNSQDQVFKANLDYVVSLGPAWAIGDPVSKHKLKTKHQNKERIHVVCSVRYLVSVVATCPSSQGLEAIVRQEKAAAVLIPTQ